MALPSFLLSRLKKIVHTLLYVVYPTYCVGCVNLIAYKQILCPSCWEWIKPIVSVYLPIGKNIELPVYAATAYQEPIKKLVLAKFSYHYVASKQLAEIMLDTLPKNVFEVDYLVPIPLHWTRYMWRGYNQSVVIAQYISSKTGIPVMHALRRNRKTAYQWKCDKAGRVQNLHNAFVATMQASHLERKRVLFIDDLCTTGSTLQSAARTLGKYRLDAMAAAVGCRAL